MKNDEEKECADVPGKSGRNHLLAQAVAASQVIARGNPGRLNVKGEADG